MSLGRRHADPTLVLAAWAREGLLVGAAVCLVWTLCAWPRRLKIGDEVLLAIMIAAPPIEITRELHTWADMSPDARVLFGSLAGDLVPRSMLLETSALALAAIAAAAIRLSATAPGEGDEAVR